MPQPKFFENEPADLIKQFLIATFVILAIFFGLVARFWYLQIARASHFKELSENNRIRVLDMPPARGIIFDRQGIMLVSSRPSFNLYVIPDDVQDWDLLKEQLSRLLHMEKDQIEERLSQKKARARPSPSD